MLPHATARANYVQPRPVRGLVSSYRGANEEENVQDNNGIITCSDPIPSKYLPFSFRLMFRKITNKYYYLPLLWEAYWCTCVPVHRCTDVPVYLCTGEPVYQSGPKWVKLGINFMAKWHIERVRFMPFFTGGRVLWPYLCAFFIFI